MTAEKTAPVAQSPTKHHKVNENHSVYTGPLATTAMFVSLRLQGRLATVLDRRRPFTSAPNYRLPLPTAANRHKPF